jgi:hypothetical protein
LLSDAAAYITFIDIALNDVHGSKFEMSPFLVGLAQSRNSLLKSSRYSGENHNGF